MRIKQDYLNVGLVLTALALLPLAHPAMAEEEVPFKGVEVGTLSAASFDFPFATILNVAEGEATQFGHYTVTGIVVVNVLSSTATGTFTMTAANGVMLFITMTGSCVTTPFS